MKDKKKRVWKKYNKARTNPKAESRHCAAMWESTGELSESLILSHDSTSIQIS